MFSLTVRQGFAAAINEMIRTRDGGGLLGGDGSGNLRNVLVGFVANHLYAVDTVIVNALQNILCSGHTQIMGADTNFQGNSFPGPGPNALWPK